MKIVDQHFLDALCAAAREHPRRRMNHNLHDSYADSCQRLLNAVEPESYIRPHRHLTPLKPETFVVLRGRFAAILFDNEGEISQVELLSPTGNLAADIAPGLWHAVLSLEPDSVFFEAKPGPYEPLSDKDWAPWAPAEADTGADAYLHKLRENVDAWIASRKPS